MPNKNRSTSLYGPHVEICWKTLEAPGATIEDLLQLCAQRLKGFQNGKLYCRHNDDAIRFVQRALSALDGRTRDRKIRGVEGTMKP